jgi:hypothetical protein
VDYIIEEFPHDGSGGQYDRFLELGKSRLWLRILDKTGGIKINWFS